VITRYTPRGSYPSARSRGREKHKLRFAVLVAERAGGELKPAILLYRPRARAECPICTRRCPASSAAAEEHNGGTARVIPSRRNHSAMLVDRRSTRPIGPPAVTEGPDTTPSLAEVLAAVLSLADLDALAKTRRGQYVLEHMPPSAQATRLAGDALIGFGAHGRSRALLLAGRPSSWPAGRMQRGRERKARHDGPLIVTGPFRPPRGYPGCARAVGGALGG
jgi:hypothetical protein